MVSFGEPSEPEETRTPNPWWPLVLVIAIVSVLVFAVSGSEQRPSRVTLAFDDPGTLRLASNAVSVFPGVTDRIAMVRSPLGFGLVPAELTMVEDGRTTVRAYEFSVFRGFGRADMAAGSRIQLVDAEIVFLSLGEVKVVSSALTGESDDLGEAVVLLPGSKPGHLWAVGSGSRTTRDLTVASRQSVSYDLAEVGIPLDSFADGLVVVPTDRSLGRFGLWGPTSAVTAIEASDGARFVGAGGTRLVFVGPGLLETYDTGESSLTVRDAPVGDADTILYEVSPNGDYLAVVHLRSAVELPLVNIIDTNTGTVVDEIDDAISWQLQWINDGEILFLRPTGTSYRFVSRDVTTGAERNLIEVNDRAYWVATGE